MRLDKRFASLGRAVPAVLAITLAFAGAAIADPLSDANRAYRSGDYQTATSLSQEAVKEEPQNPKAYIALGTCLHKTGDSSGALAAWNNALQLDPQLMSVQNHANFQQAYAAVGGDPSRILAGGSGNPPASAGDPAQGNADANAIIKALSSGNVYVHPQMADDIDANAIADATRSVSPTVVKVVVVPKLGDYPSPSAMADALRKQLELDENGAVIVATPRRIGASCARLSDAQINQAFSNAGLAAAFAQGGLNQALPVAVRAFSTEVTTDRRNDNDFTGAATILVVAAVFAGLGFFAMKRKREMTEAKAPIESVRQEVIKNLSYVDGYLDLLPKGEEADRAKQLRADAYARFATATGLMHRAKRPDELHQASPLLMTALSELEECRRDIDRATGGTGVAMAIPDIPDLSTDATRSERFQRVEAIRSRDEAERLQRDIQSIPATHRGVSFFSGQPMPREALVPVSIVIGGQKRTVLATRSEAEQIMRGQTPAVRAFPDNSGRYVPWYENRGYDPYRDYYGNWGGYGDGGLGTFVDLMLLSHLFDGGGFFGGYGGWGYGPEVVNNYNYYDGYTDPMNAPGGFGGLSGNGNDGGQQIDPAPEHSGGFDFFGQGGYNDQSNDGSFGNDSSGGDSGGIDFGGGDFGGSDSGGGDFGGGDFGGGGDSG